MSGGNCGLFPSLEASRQAREEKEKAMLPAMIKKVALPYLDKKPVTVREYIEALEICDRQGLHTLEDVLAAYRRMEAAE